MNPGVGDWTIISLKHSSNHGTYVYVIEQVGINKNGPVFDVVNFYNKKDRRLTHKRAAMFEADQ